MKGGIGVYNQCLSCEIQTKSCINYIVTMMVA